MYTFLLNEKKEIKFFRFQLIFSTIQSKIESDVLNPSSLHKSIHSFCLKHKKAIIMEILPLLQSNCLSNDIVLNEIYNHLWRMKTPLSSELKDAIIWDHFHFKKIVMMYYKMYLAFSYRRPPVSLTPLEHDRRMTVLFVLREMHWMGTTSTIGEQSS